MNLTPKRLRALRMIQQRPGLLAQALVELCETNACALMGRERNGFCRSRTGAQAATRWGMAYAKPLAEAGLVVMRGKFPNGATVYAGGASLTLTELGEHVARSGQMPT